MGNCMKTCRAREEAEEEHEQEQDQEQWEEIGKEKRFRKGSELEKGSMKVKIVLTKDELELLLVKLKDNEGKALEDLLREIEKGRSGKVEAWRPSLESIMEDAEGLETDR